ncbi:Cytochrome P450 6a22 [Gonioctena quinquepunctata]|nr:Cytochrome P450 6a22 [Gonioctena quinquepunctata]
MLKLRIFEQEISDFFVSIVDETIKMREQKGIVRLDLIHLLMEARKDSYKYEEDSGMIDTGFSAVKESDIGKIS